jgi:hypothetical protein
MEIIENSLSVPERPPGRVQRLSASLAGNDAEAVVLDLVIHRSTLWSVHQLYPN